MHRALPIQFALIALIALFLTACGLGTPSAAVLDGPSTTFTLATSEGGVGTLGVPFVDNQPVVTSVGVAISTVVDASVVELRFTLEDGVYTYDPAGGLTAIDFAYTGSATVTLPAGRTYDFATRGADAVDVWMAYGETAALVDVSTTGVPLALQTVIATATLVSAPSIDAIAADQSVDLLLAVTSPGGYAVPMADYTVSYQVATADGTTPASSKLGTRVVAHANPTDDRFTATATVTGWRDMAGTAVWTDGVTAIFDVPFTVASGLGFDGTAPVASISAPATGNVGSPLTVSGTATDDASLDRAQVYAGPVLIASSDSGEAVGGVALLELGTGGAWSFSWTPSEVRSYTLTAVAIDTSGNEHRASTTVDAAVPPTTLTFDYNTPGSATVAAGESLILSGATFSGFDPRHVNLAFWDGANLQQIPTDGIQQANGKWTLPWTAPASGTYRLHFDFYDGIESYNSEINLTVQ